MGVRGGETRGITDQLLAVTTWLRGRYESAPPAELAMLAAVIGYLETVAEHAQEHHPATAGEHRAAAVPAGAAPGPHEGWEPHWSQALGEETATRGTFRETAAGGTVTDDAGRVRELPYAVVAAAGLRHGDRVWIRPPREPHGYGYYTRTGATAPVEPSPVREGVGVLASDTRQLRVNVDGQMMRAVAAQRRIGDLHDGQPVSVRYEPSAPERGDAVAYVVRVHDAAESPAPSAVRRSPKPQREAEDAAAAGEAAAPPAAAPLQGPKPRILIVGGHPRARLHYGEAMSAVAHVEWVHGQKVTPSLRRRVETAKAIVLVTQHMTHPVSNYIQRVLRETRKPSIHARSQNHSGLVPQIIQELLPQLGIAPSDPPGGSSPPQA